MDVILGLEAQARAGGGARSAVLCRQAAAAAAWGGRARALTAPSMAPSTALTRPPPPPTPPEQASAALEAQPGLLELLACLRAAGVKVGLVTRNTTESLNAFFEFIGEEASSVFDVALTRDNTPFVKPDPRSLLHFAEVRSAGVGGRVLWIERLGKPGRLASLAAHCPALLQTGLGPEAVRAAHGGRQYRGH